MDINTQIQVSAEKVIAEKLPQMIQLATESMIQGIIKEVFSNYSPLAKEVKSKIEEQLDINLQNFALCEYNVIVAKIINEQLLSCINEDVVKPIKQLTKDAVSFVQKKKMKLSEVYDMFIERMIETSSDMEGEITFIVKVNDKNGWIEVFIDDEAGIKADDCSLRFLISSRSGNIFSLSTNHWIMGKGPITPAKMVSISDCEKLIFRLYAAQVKIEIDELEFNNTWSRYDD